MTINLHPGAVPLAILERLYRSGEPARLEAQVFRLSGHPAVLQRDRD